MGSQHQPRRNDAQRVIDRQTRARHELMRRQELENIRGNIAAIQKLVDEGPAIPARAMNDIRSTHRLTWYQLVIRDTCRFFVQLWAGIVDIFWSIK